MRSDQGGRAFSAIRRQTAEGSSDLSPIRAQSAQSSSNLSAIRTGSAESSRSSFTIRGSGSGALGQVERDKPIEKRLRRGRLYQLQVANEVAVAARRARVPPHTPNLERGFPTVCRLV